MEIKYKISKNGDYRFERLFAVCSNILKLEDTISYLGESSITDVAFLYVNDVDTNTSRSAIDNYDHFYYEYYIDYYDLYRDERIERAIDLSLLSFETIPIYD